MTSAALPASTSTSNVTPLRPERGSPEPRYQRVLAALTERIGAGEYAVGSLLPTEAELCAEFSVSRFTVREALRRLVETGLVARQQGHGTRVLAAEPSRGYVQSMRSLEGLFQYAKDARFHIAKIMRTVPRPALAATLGRVAGREWVQIDGVRRTAEGEALCTTRVYLHEDFAAIAEEVREIEGAIYRLIEGRFDVRVEEVRQELTAEPLKAANARALGREKGSPGICVTRRYIDGEDRPIMVTINHYAADRFSYSMTLKREELG